MDVQPDKPAEAAGSGMYKFQPYYDSDKQIEMPTNMYTLKSIYDTKTEIVSQEVTELEKRQEAILERLNKLKVQVDELTKQYGETTTTATRGTHETSPVGDGLHDIVINADPARLPLSLFVLYQMLLDQYKVFTTVHCHSSAKSVPATLKQPFQNNGSGELRANCQLAITLIWKSVEYGPSMMVDPSKQSPVIGEANIARYLSRLLPSCYENGNITTATEIDTILDLATLLQNGNQKEKGSVIKNLNVKLGKSNWLVGDTLTLADIVAWSAVRQTQEVDSLPGNVKKWVKSCNDHAVFRTALHVL